MGGSFTGPIISLGPQTDAALDRFRLNDSLVPRLRGLTQTIRSSRWEEVLRTEWGLTFEQAVTISGALRSDLSGYSTPVEVNSVLYYRHNLTDV